MPIIVELSMLLSAEMKLPICLKPFDSSRTFRITLIFLVLRIFSCISLVLVGCVLVGCILVGCVETNCFYCVANYVRFFNVLVDVGKEVNVDERNLLVDHWLPVTSR